MVDYNGNSQCCRALYVAWWRLSSACWKHAIEGEAVHPCRMFRIPSIIVDIQSNSRHFCQSPEYPNAVAFTGMAWQSSDRDGTMKSRWQTCKLPCSQDVRPITGEDMPSPRFRLATRIPCSISRDALRIMRRCACGGVKSLRRRCLAHMYGLILTRCSTSRAHGQFSR
jgi:hypothetical protein